MIMLTFAPSNEQVRESTFEVAFIFYQNQTSLHKNRSVVNIFSSIAPVNLTCAPGPSFSSRD